MMTPAFSDVFALLGVDIVLCAVVLWLPFIRRWPAKARKLILAMVFLALWIPVGAAFLPVLSYVRGVGADFSVSLIVLASASIFFRVSGRAAIGPHELRAVYAVVAIAAFGLYPFALGLGNWDSYRTGWGTWWMWSVLGLLCAGTWFSGLRWVPMLLGLSLVAWSFGVMESGNLWDYLMDPWLAVIAIYSTVNLIISSLFGHYVKKEHPS